MNRVDTHRACKATFCLAFLSLLESCAPKPQQVDVQVFIVTRGGESVKLGLVEVQAIPRDEAIAALKAAYTERDNHLKEFAGTVEENKRDLDAANQNEADAENAVKQARDYLYRARQAAAAAAKAYAASAGDSRTADGSLRTAELENALNTTELEITFHSKRLVEIVSQSIWANLPAYRDSVLDAARVDDDAEERLRKAKEEVERLSGDSRDSLPHQRHEITTPRRLFAALPPSSVSAKTDADGKCRLSLLRKNRWVIVATGDRDMVGSHESYTWIVELPNDASASSALTLSNDNLLRAGINPLPSE
jgi:hypothetical protein